MSCKIYCIEDINDLKYVGSTTLTLKERFKVHKYDKKKDKTCSSKKLDLDNCEIKLLETCDISHKKEREKYWINQIDCVNIIKLNFDKKEYNNEWCERNREKVKEYKKVYHKKNHQYQKSWGGDKRYNNNLLKIDITLFQ